MCAEPSDKALITIHDLAPEIREKVFNPSELNLQLTNTQGKTAKQIELEEYLESTRNNGD